MLVPDAWLYGMEVNKGKENMEPFQLILPNDSIRDIAGLRPENKLHPAADIIAYTYFDYNPRFTADDPAGFFIVGTRDWLVPVEAVKKDAAGLKRAGADVELHTPKNAEHGFDAGNGTSAEGWIQKAVSFGKNIWYKRFMERRKINGTENACCLLFVF